MKTVYDVFIRGAENYGDRPFIHIPASAAASYSDSPVDHTYGDALVHITHLKNIYQDAGYSTGHRVGLLLENRAEFFFHWLALNALGVCIVPLNGDFSPQEMQYVISLSGMELIVSLPDKISFLEALAGPPVSCPQLTNLPLVSPALDNSSACAMLYTSGSTGQPKGCVLSNDYFIAFGEWYRDLGGLCALKAGQERLLTPLPLVHMNALACSTMGMMMVGGCIIQLDRFHPRNWWETVRTSGATIVHYLGVLPAILLNLDDGENDRTHSVRFGFGAGVNPKHHAAFEERFGFPLIEAWAMTESGAGGCITANHEPRHVGECCFGKPTDKVAFRLIDEQGVEVEKGSPGELLVRAAGDNPKYGFFDHYHENPAATDETWQDDWLYTGDIVREGPDGSLFFVDRRKNVIRRSGENISALEVESTLSLDPAIDQVAVAPVADDIRGDEVMACIVLKEGATATGEDIFQRCYKELSYFKVPGYIAFVDALPLTASRKLKRGDMKSLCARLVKNGTAQDFRKLKKRSSL